MNLRLNDISLVIGYCNGIDIVKYPLSKTDYDGIERSTNINIDVGAFQYATLSPTKSPTYTPSNAPNVENVYTNQPTFVTTIETLLNTTDDIDNESSAENKYLWIIRVFVMIWILII
eukprot:106615_1